MLRAKNKNDMKTDPHELTSFIPKEELLLDTKCDGYNGFNPCYQIGNENQLKMSKSNYFQNESLKVESEGRAKNEITAKPENTNNSPGAAERNSKAFHQVEPFHHAYHVGKVLGKGGFGVVYEGTRIRDGLQVALKHISKSKITDFGQVNDIYY